MIMKTHYVISLTFFCIFLCSCSGMYDNINSYYSEGETNYIAKVESVSTNAGHNRVQITWKVNTDPRIKSDRAYNVQKAGEMEKAALEARLTIPMFETSFQYLVSPKLILPLKNPSPSLGFTFKPWLADLITE